MKFTLGKHGDRVQMKQRILYKFTILEANTE